MNVFILTIHNPEISLGPTARLNGFLKSREYAHHVTTTLPPFARKKTHTKFDTFVILLKIMNYIIKNRKKIDLIHVVTPPSYPGILAILAKKLFKIPYVVDVGDPYAENMASLHNLSKDSHTFKLLKKIDDSIYKNAEHLILTSDGLEEYVPSHPLHTTILTGVADIETTTPRDIPVSKKCLYLGQFGPLQNFEYILQVFTEAIKKDPEISLDIYGQGTIENRENLPSKINFFDPISPNKIPELAANYALGIVSLKLDPSLDYAIPTKLLSYLSLGLPVFGTGGSSAAKLTETAAAGRLATSYNVEEDSNKLLDLLNDPETLKKYSGNAINFANNTLSYDTAGAALLKIYNFSLQ